MANRTNKASLDASAFAVPAKRVLRIDDERHVRLAWENVSRVAGLTAKERKLARVNILAQAEVYGIDTAAWNKTAEAESARLWCPLSISAMGVSLQMPKEDHPNKMPFSGVLTKLDQPSNVPPKGSAGRRTQVTKEAAQNALNSLLGMAVDYKPGFTGHDPQQKIGVITAASIEGDEIRVGGFVYAHDFPEVAADISKHKDVLGFSFEAADIYVTDPDSDILEIQALTFTGAAIMQKSLAAYQSTSLAAEAEETTEEETMDKETKDALDKMGTDLAGVVTAIGSLTKLVTLQASGHLDKVKPHADAIEAEANRLQAAGIGLHPTHGHVAVLRRMAASMCAEASNGVMPSTFSGSIYASGDPVVTAAPDITKALADAVKPINDAVAALGTKLADMQAAAATAAASNGNGTPARKTLPPEITNLLTKAGITIEAGAENQKIPVATVDAALQKAGIRGERAIEVKGVLHASGLID